MRRTTRVLTGTATLLFLTQAAGAAPPPAGALKRCAKDAVVSGTICIDKYEASVWRIPNATTTNRGLVARLRSGTATGAELVGAGAIQLGGSGDDFAPCDDNGQNCTGDIFAASLPFATPSANVTWFQAQQACKNSGKRLPSNAEWQASVAGTPDPGPDDRVTTCATMGFGRSATGSRSACVSSDGAFDMVGNVYEWVADWVPRSPFYLCDPWGPETSPTSDEQCLLGAETSGEPGALLRGGGFNSGTKAGPFAILGGAPPSYSDPHVGFRCAR